MRSVRAACDQLVRRALRCRRSTSTSTGVAPSAATADAVGTAVNAGTITSSPAATPTAASASCSAAAPDDTATACRAPSHVGELGLERGGLVPEQEAAARHDAPRRPRRTSSARSSPASSAGRRQVPRVVTIEGGGAPHALVELGGRVASRAPRRWPCCRCGTNRCRSAGDRAATAAANRTRCRCRVASITIWAISASEWSMSLPTLKTWPTAPSVGGGQHGVDDIVDVQAVATLAAVAEELDRLVRAAPCG